MLRNMVMWYSHKTPKYYKMQHPRSQRWAYEALRGGSRYFRTGKPFLSIYGSIAGPDLIKYVTHQGPKISLLIFSFNLATNHWEHFQNAEILR